MNPRYYQREFVEAVLKEWGDEPGALETHRKTVGVLPTSSGKTICAALLFRRIVDAGGRPLFCGDTDELCVQPLQKIHRAVGMICGLEKAESRAPLQAEAVVGSLQTMSRSGRLERFPRDHFTHIIFDEAHRNVELHKKVCEYFSHAKVLGITATAFRSNMKDLSAYYDSVAYRLEMFDMVDAGFIPPIKVMTLPIDVDISDVKQSKTVDGKDYNVTELGSVIRPYYEAIADAIIEKLSGRQIVAFLPLIESSKEFVSVCLEKGIMARHVDGTSADRDMILEGFGQKRFQLISNSSVLSTGWDCPNADTLLNLRPTQSVGLFRQMAGRTVRVLPGVIDHLTEEDQDKERRDAIAASQKPHALIVDLLWQTERFGLTGAASLIAQNDDDFASLQGKVRKASEEIDLQFINTEFRQEKEAEVIAALQRAAERRSLYVDAREIGVLLHQPEITDYEPMFSWEKKTVSDKQKGILLRNGVDPETVSSRGQASRIIDEIFDRKRTGRVSVRTARTLLEKGITYTDRTKEIDAGKMLGDSTPFPFGKHRGTPLKDIPIGYWKWLEGQDWFTEHSHPIPYQFMITKISPSLPHASVG